MLTSNIFEKCVVIWFEPRHGPQIIDIFGERPLVEEDHAENHFLRTYDISGEANLEEQTNYLSQWLYFKEGYGYFFYNIFIPDIIHQGRGKYGSILLFTIKERKNEVTMNRHDKIQEYISNIVQEIKTKELKSIQFFISLE